MRVRGEPMADVFWKLGTDGLAGEKVCLRKPGSVVRR
jgi:hypothetical protein